VRWLKTLIKRLCEVAQIFGVAPIWLYQAAKDDGVWALGLGR